jgi:hypothetical protein
MLKITYGVAAPALFLCLLLPTLANAQTSVYVTGEFFAEAMQLSRTTVSPELADGVSDLVNPDDGVTFGGGGRIGAFFSPVWSLEFGFDAGKAVGDERTRSLGNSTGLPLPLPSLQFVARTTQQFTAASVLVGFHPVVRGRIQPGFRGGVSFMRAERQFAVASISIETLTPTRPGGGGVILPTLPTISIATSQYAVVNNGLTATLAAEAAIDFTEHFGVVPEIRAHAGGIGAILLRPGVAVRWRW